MSIWGWGNRPTALGFLAGATIALGAAAGIGPLSQEIGSILLRRHVSSLTPGQVAGLKDADPGAFLRRLDPYGDYLSPAEYGRFKEGGVPSAQGIGAQFLHDRDALRLIPFPGGPLALAGLERPAVLLAVDGRPLSGLSPAQVLPLLQGEAGSRVGLDVRMPDSGERRSLQVTRGRFEVPSVSLVDDNGLPVLQVWVFQARGTVTALARGVAQVAAGDAPVVIDLRQATGGDLFEALDATSLFLAGGVEVGAVEEGDGGRRRFSSLPDRRLLTGPVVLLIGRHTASAAEAFVRALRWHHAAVLVGEATYGKCLTQTLVPLSNGGALRFSNGRVLGPEGSPCEQRGILPDVPVASADDLPVAGLLRALLTWLDRGGGDDGRMPLAGLRRALASALQGGGP